MQFTLDLEPLRLSSTTIRWDVLGIFEWAIDDVRLTFCNFGVSLAFTPEALFEIHWDLCTSILPPSTHGPDCVVLLYFDFRSISFNIDSVHMHYAFIELASSTVKEDTSCDDISLHKLYVKG